MTQTFALLCKLLGTDSGKRGLTSKTPDSGRLDDLFVAEAGPSTPMPPVEPARPLSTNAPNQEFTAEQLQAMAAQIADLQAKTQAIGVKPQPTAYIGNGS